MNRWRFRVAIVLRWNRARLIECRKKPRPEGTGPGLELGSLGDRLQGIGGTASGRRIKETGAGHEIVWRGGGLTDDLFRPRFFDACLPSRPANVFQKLLALRRIGTVFYVTLLDT
jgi:hypothetical protein